MVHVLKNIMADSKLENAIHPQNVIISVYTPAISTIKYTSDLRTKKKLELQNLCKECEVTIFCEDGKKKLTIKELKIALEKKLGLVKRDGRSTNKSDEKIRINKLCVEINNNTYIGKRLKYEYEKTFGRIIKSVSQTGGNRDHYDMLVTEEENEYYPETTRKIEEKHSKNAIRDNINPWEDSVQRYNGPAGQFSICKDYAQKWYDSIICDIEIKKTYCEDCEIPIFEDWYNMDVKANGDPRTIYGKTLKQNYRKKHPNSSMNGKNNSPFDYRERVNLSFLQEFNESELKKQKMIEETQIVLDGIMKEKEGWLQTTGDIETKTFNFKWSKQIASPKIKNVVASYNKGADIYYNFKAEQEDGTEDNFNSIIRFGKGTGFSNMRCDIR